MGERVSDEAAPDETWEEVACSWRLDELLAGRMSPTTKDDVQTLMVIGALRSRRPLNADARHSAFEAMMSAAVGRAVAGADQAGRDPARIEQTRQAMLRAYEAAQEPREERPGGNG